MAMYHIIKIHNNSDCWAEIDKLKELLKHNKRYLPEDFSNADVVAIAVDELYDRLMAEKRNGENQRKF